MTKFRWYLAWVLLIGSVIGWPLSTFWWAKNEPPFVLGLSWLAVILTAVDVINTVDVRKQQEKGEDENNG